MPKVITIPLAECTLVSASRDSVSLCVENEAPAIDIFFRRNGRRAIKAMKSLEGKHGEWGLTFKETEKKAA